MEHIVSSGTIDKPFSQLTVDEKELAWRNSGDYLTFASFCRINEHQEREARILRGEINRVPVARVTPENISDMSDVSVRLFLDEKDVSTFSQPPLKRQHATAGSIVTSQESTQPLSDEEDLTTNDEDDLDLEDEELEALHGLSQHFYDAGYTFAYRRLLEELDEAVEINYLDRYSYRSDFRPIIDQLMSDDRSSHFVRERNS